MDNFITRAEHEEFAKRMEDEHNRQNRRITLLEDNIKLTQELTLSIEKMAISMKCMLDEQKRQGERLEALEGVPKKNLDALKFAIIGAIGTAIGAAFIAAITNFL